MDKEFIEFISERDNYSIDYLSKKSIIETLSLREKSSFNEIVLISEKAKILNLQKNMGYIQANLSILKETIEDN